MSRTVGRVLFAHISAISDAPRTSSNLGMRSQSSHLFWADLALMCPESVPSWCRCDTAGPPLTFKQLG